MSQFPDSVLDSKPQDDEPWLERLVQTYSQPREQPLQQQYLCYIVLTAKLLVFQQVHREQFAQTI